MTDQTVLDKLDRIEQLLQRLVQPLAAEEARQLLQCTDEQRREHNKGVLQRAKARQKHRVA